MNTQPHRSHDDTGNASLLIAGPNSLLNGAIAAAAQAHDITHVRIARTLTETLHALSTQPPAIAAIDLELAVADGFRVIRRIKEQAPSVRVVVLASDDDDPRLLTDCFIIGVDGMVSKDRGVDSLLTVLNVVRRGERAVPRRIAASLIDALREMAVPRSTDIRFTVRQRQVLQLIAEGLTDREIGERLHISPTTVRAHLKEIFERTSTTNRTAAARWLRATDDKPDDV